VLSPAYDDGSTEPEIEERSLERYGLARVRNDQDGSGPT